MKRVLLVTFGVVALLLLARVDVFACTCLPSPALPLKRQVRMALSESRAVFSGKVLEVIEDTEAFSVVVRFRVDRFWKGSPTRAVRVVTGRGGGDCGYRFEVGESYLVYAHASGESGLGTNICQRTARLSEASKDLRVLGKGRAAPRQGAGRGRAKAARRGGSGSLDVASARLQAGGCLTPYVVVESVSVDEVAADVRDEK